jgi:hypothetical protein
MGLPLEGSRRPFDRNLWPEDIPEGAFLYRALNRRLIASAMQPAGGDPYATETERIWQELVDGKINTAILASGRLLPIEPGRWEGERREFYSTGKAPVDGLTGDIYVLRDPASEPPEWWPQPEQTLVSWATDPVVQREAERRLKAAGATVSETAMVRAMEAMAREAGQGWRAPSIATTRDRAR